MNAHGLLSRQAGRLAAATLLVLGCAGTAAAAPGWAPAVDIGPANPSLAAAGEGPAVAIDADGGLVAVWRRCGVPDGACEVLAAERRPGAAWAAPVAIGTHASLAPVVAFTPDGTAVAAWAAGVPATVALAARAPGGAWQPEGSQTGLPTGTVNGLEIGAAGDGSVTLAWIESAYFASGFPPSTVVRASRRSAAGAWEAPTSLQAGGGATGMRLAVGANGDAVALWRDQVGIPILEPAQRRLRTTHRPASGPWGAAESLEEGGNLIFSASPDVAVDAAGVATAAWISSAGPYLASILHVARRPADGPWTQATEGVSLQTSYPGEPFLKVGSLPGGEALVAFKSGQTVAPLTVKTVAADGAIGPPAAIAPDEARDRPRLAVAGGLAILTWRQQVGYGTPVWNVRVAERSPAGTWSPPDAIGGAPSEFTPTPALVAADAGGRAVAVWATSGGRVLAAQRDPVPPRIAALGVPATGIAGAAVPFSVDAVDDFSGLAGPPAWAFGDGASAAGPQVSHAYASPGTYTVAVTAADLAGQTTRQERTIQVAAAPPPPSSTRPRAVTLAPLHACASGMRLRGAVTPRGLATTWRFAFGTGGFGQTTPARTLRAGGGRRVVSRVVRGLRPGAVYRVRLEATNARGTTRGPVQRFRMAPVQLGPWPTRRTVPPGFVLRAVTIGGERRFVALAVGC
jgi:hypothetical protein